LGYEFKRQRILKKFRGRKSGHRSGHGRTGRTADYGPVASVHFYYYQPVPCRLNGFLQLWVVSTFFQTVLFDQMQYSDFSARSNPTKIPKIIKEPKNLHTGGLFQKFGTSLRNNVYKLSILSQVKRPLIFILIDAHNNSIT